jgi:excisionase family DNA binding protein
MVSANRKRRVRVRTLSPEEVAARIPCGLRLAADMIRAKVIPSILVGKRRRVPVDAFNAYIAGQTAPPKPAPRPVLVEEDRKLASCGPDN